MCVSFNGVGEFEGLGRICGENWDSRGEEVGRAWGWMGQGRERVARQGDTFSGTGERMGRVNGLLGPTLATSRARTKNPPMWPSPKSRHLRWPPWAGGGDFRRRAESALTHPVTVAALGVLLLNDLLLKAIWPHSWLTGKLSDLAWLVFALPLLAFLLSFATRGNLTTARRLSFLAAYAGLPLLYAAFNTFDPVHDLIMRGISLAGGAAGSPRDATDSLVIPLAWVAALWVWRRPPAASGAMRLRWAVLVAGVAALASVATSQLEPLPVRGATLVGISEGAVVVVALDSVIYESLDGGLTWNSSALPWEAVSWGGQSVDTPTGRYTFDGPRILCVSANRCPEQVAFSTEYLQRDANVWVQRTSTQDLGNL